MATILTTKNLNRFRLKQFAEVRGLYSVFNPLNQSYSTIERIMHSSIKLFFKLFVRFKPIYICLSEEKGPRRPILVALKMSFWSTGCMNGVVFVDKNLTLMKLF